LELGFFLSCVYITLEVSQLGSRRQPTGQAKIHFSCRFHIEGTHQQMPFFFGDPRICSGIELHQMQSRGTWEGEKPPCPGLAMASQRKAGMSMALLFGEEITCVSMDILQLLLIG
jgi:hypothetical protein